MFYTSSIAFKWILKKTKKDCWETYKQNWWNYTIPAKITPKIISETYDEIKKFLSMYYEKYPILDEQWNDISEDREWWTYKIVSSADMADYTFESRCFIRVFDKEWNCKYDSRDYMWYNQRRRMCLAFFDDIEPFSEEDAKWCVPVEDEWTINTIKFTENDNDIPF